MSSFAHKTDKIMILMQCFAVLRVGGERSEPPASIEYLRDCKVTETQSYYFIKSYDSMILSCERYQGWALSPLYLKKGMLFLMSLDQSIPIFNKKFHVKLWEQLFSFLCKSFQRNLSSRLAEGFNFHFVTISNYAKIAINNSAVL